MRLETKTSVAVNLSKITAQPEAPGVFDPEDCIELHSPVSNELRGFAAENVKHSPLVMVAPDLFKGQSLALCGAGPSLKDAKFNGEDHVFACNSALPYLVARGVRVTAGVGIDQTPGLLDEWKDPPNVPYYVASTCDPALIRHLREHGCTPIFFHNFVGLMDEDGNVDEYDYYCATWPNSYMVAQGFTVVDRFIGVAQWMGFTQINIYGADHAFGPDDQAHANGDSATEAYGNPLIMEGEIDGRVWRTRPDMLLAAVELARRVRDSGGTITLVGDGLPHALLGKDDAFLDQVCRKLSDHEKVIGIAQLNTPNDGS